MQVAWRGRPFAGATGQSKADKFDTEGVNIRARKIQGWEPLNDTKYLE